RGAGHGSLRGLRAHGLDHHDPAPLGHPLGDHGHLGGHDHSVAAPAVGAAVQWLITFPVVIGLSALGTALGCAIITRLEGAYVEPFWPGFRATLPVNAVITLTICTGFT